MIKPPLKNKVQRGDIADSIRFLSPIKETVEIKGKLFYSDSDQAWNLIRIKKELLHEFPHLKEKDIEGLVYYMKLYRNYGELKQFVESLEKSSATIPIVLFIGQEKLQGQNQK